MLELEAEADALAEDATEWVSAPGALTPELNDRRATESEFWALVLRVLVLRLLVLGVWSKDG